MKYVLYNPHSGGGATKDSAEAFVKELNEEVKLVDVTELEGYGEYLSSLAPEDDIYVFGGDGTLNRFINGIDEADIKNNIYYYPAGTGNDFYTDVMGNAEKQPILINKYLVGLPTVTVNGRDYKFINGIGFGIDGYCCEIGDKMRDEGKKPNYTSIAINGLLFHYKPTGATVIVDGEERRYEKVWLAPAMFGGRYGGGMMPTPGQSREGERQLSLLVFHGSGKLKTLIMFPGIFKGKHVKHTKNVAVMRGRTITVRFDRPTPLQIDGETILDVTEYTARI